MKLEGKVAVVTGGGTGIGKAISLALANEGAVRGMAKNRGISYKEMMGKIADKNSLKRIAEPSEIAACVVFLASDDSSAVTGHNLVASCGFHLTHPEEIR